MSVKKWRLQNSRQDVCKNKPKTEIIQNLDFYIVSYFQVSVLVKTKSVNLDIARWKLKIQFRVLSSLVSLLRENSSIQDTLCTVFSKIDIYRQTKQKMVPRFCGRDIFKKMAHIQPRSQGKMRDPGNEVGPHSRHQKTV